MTWMIAKVVVGVLVLTAFFTWTMVWFVSSWTSENPKVRRRVQFADGLVSLGMAVFYGLRALTGKESKLALIWSALVIALWVFRTAKSLFYRH